VNEPHSHLFEGPPRLHFLEWNPGAPRTIILLHGNSANAWWWEAVVREMSRDFRVLALDQRGHGDSEWVRPAAYAPAHYADDLAKFIVHVMHSGEKPLVVGHSMGGLSVLAFAAAHQHAARGAIAIDSAIISSKGRDRFLRHLKALPVVTYPDLETAKKRYRLMPNEGEIAPAILSEVAERSLARTEEGRWTLKFDRESFFGRDGLDVLGALKSITIPTLLVRAEKSRIMTVEGVERALEANRHAKLVTIPGAHHHVLLEMPSMVARAIEDFASSLE
jgi:pimeloyl-ACP methyl ester carboxylesterase